MDGLRRAALTMSEAFHTPVEFWLNQTLDELMDWAEAAHRMNKDREDG